MYVWAQTSPAQSGLHQAAAGHFFAPCESYCTVGGRLGGGTGEMAITCPPGWRTDYLTVTAAWSLDLRLLGPGSCA